MNPEKEITTWAVSRLLPMVRLSIPPDTKLPLELDRPPGWYAGSGLPGVQVVPLASA